MEDRTADLLEELFVEALELARSDSPVKNAVLADLVKQLRGTIRRPGQH